MSKSAHEIITIGIKKACEELSGTRAPEMAKQHLADGIMLAAIYIANEWTARNPEFDRDFFFKQCGI